MTADLDPLIERLRKLSNGGPFSLITAAAAAIEALREELTATQQARDDINAQKNEITMEALSLRAERDAAREALRLVEWVDFTDSDDGPIRFCAACRSDPQIGHYKDCAVSAALAAKEPKHD